jgi:hypothetical protein
LFIRRYRYAEIRDLYIGQLAYVWVTDSTEATRANVEKKIDNFVEGNLEHATEMFSALWKIANKDGNVAAPSNVSPNVSPFSSLFSPALRQGAHSRSSARSGYESRPLGLCEDRAYKIDPHRGLL